MAKTVEIRVDADSSALSVESGRLFLGTVSRIRLDGWLPNEGHEPVLTMFPHDCGTPLAQSRVEDGVLVLDLTGAALRRSFRCAPMRRQFALYLNQRGQGEDGKYLPDVEAVGSVFVDWSPEVFDVGTGEVATLKGPPGRDGADGLSAYQLAVANGYRGTVEEWLAGLKGADGAPGAPGADGADGMDGLSAFGVAVKNGFSGTEAEWLASLKGEDADESRFEFFKRYVVSRPMAGEGDVYQLEDCAVNVVSIPSPGVFTFVFPPRVEGRVRDFVLKLEVTADPLPTVQFVKHPTDGEPPRFEGDEGWSDLALGVNFFGFTETS